MKRVACLVGLVACGQSLQEPPAPPFRVAVSVEADKGVPLPGVVIQRNNEEVGKTDGTGKAILTFRGAEGDQLDVWIKCPEGFDSPTKPVTLALRRLSDPNKLAEYPVACPPAERKVVVAVRSDNGSNLPIKYLGRDIARTDAFGSATFMLTAKPGDHLDFALDTSDKANEALRPQNPMLSVVVNGRDDYYPIDQPFQVQKTKFVVIPRHLPQQIGPTPLRY